MTDRPGVDDRLKALFGLEGKTAVVLGATGGLGSASALALAAAGAAVVVSGRDAAAATRVAEEIRAFGGQAFVELADVGSPEAVNDLARRCNVTHGGVDILVNCFGIVSGGPSASVDDAEWHRVINTNLSAVFYACRAFGTEMLARGSGKIINVASTDGLVGVAEEAAYTAAKAGAVQLTRSLAAEWRRGGVHVNCLAPGDFEVPRSRAASDDPDYLQWLSTELPLGRRGEPFELAGAVIFLASAASDLVVGHCLVVDGGWLAARDWRPPAHRERPSHPEARHTATEDTGA